MTTRIKQALLATTVMGVVVVMAGGCGSPASLPSSTGATAITPPAISPVADSASAASQAAVTNCAPSLVGHGFRVDPRHTGKLRATTYSASADVQAALEYDQLQSATRTVLLHRSQGSRGRVDGVASCVSMQFSSAHLANRFLLSYEALRRQAGRFVQRESVRRGTGVNTEVGYLEHDQAFRGYGISSINVVEVAAQRGVDLFIGTYAGRHPTTATPARLVRSMMDAA